VVTKCSTIVLQKALIGAFCNTFVLHLEFDIESINGLLGFYSSKYAQNYAVCKCAAVVIQSTSDVLVNICL